VVKSPTSAIAEKWHGAQRDGSSGCPCHGSEHNCRLRIGSDRRPIGAGEGMFVLATVLAAGVTFVISHHQQLSKLSRQRTKQLQKAFANTILRACSALSRGPCRNGRQPNSDRGRALAFARAITFSFEQRKVVT
jgi:hypothetical protein